MTENEAKAMKWMKCVKDDAIVTLDHIKNNEPNVSPMLYAGRKEKSETIIKGFEELEQYRLIGTVEECREAMEKQRAKKVNNEKILRDFNNITYSVRGNCPNCGNIELLSMNTYYCNTCGQKLDWENKPRTH